MVIQKFESGIGTAQLQRRYGIGEGETIQNWGKKYAKDYLLNKVVRIEAMDEKDKVKKLTEEI